MSDSPRVSCLAVIFALGAAGCAAADHEPAAAASPATHAELPPRLVGVWEGVETGREMANAAGPSASKAQVTIAGDGTWTSATQGGRATGHVAVARRGRLELDGNLVSEGHDDRPGAAVRFRLTPRGNRFLVGSPHDYVNGHAADTTIELDKVR